MCSTLRRLSCRNATQISQTCFAAFAACSFCSPSAFTVSSCCFAVSSSFPCLSFICFELWSCCRSEIPERALLPGLLCQRHASQEYAQKMKGANLLVGLLRRVADVWQKLRSSTGMASSIASRTDISWIVSWGAHLVLASLGEGLASTSKQEVLHTNVREGGG